MEFTVQYVSFLCEQNKLLHWYNSQESVNLAKNQSCDEPTHLQLRLF
jgi:hypothetical protein